MMFSIGIQDNNISVHVNNDIITRDTVHKYLKINSPFSNKGLRIKYYELMRQYHPDKNDNTDEQDNASIIYVLYKNLERYYSTLDIDKTEKLDIFDFRHVYSRFGLLKLIYTYINI